MRGERLRLLRLARGMSLDDLAVKMGSIVTKQAISKYERGISEPSPRVLTKLARVLGVKTSRLFAEPHFSVDFIAYRKGSGLREREQERVRSLVTETLEDVVNLQELTGDILLSDIPIQSEKIEKEEDVENVACKIRQKWELGTGPIANVTSTLEDHNVFVINVNANEKFEGISAVAKSEDGEVRAAAVASRKHIPGERQRLNLAHELGHLVLSIPSKVNEEKAVFRFGKAFLTPKEVIYKEIGTKRSNINLEELMLLKKKFGISLQAIVYRLKELDIIKQSHYAEFFTFINKQGWKKREPGELEPEQPKWLRKSVLRAFSEGLMPFDKAERLLGEKLHLERKTSLTKRRSFMQLSLTERRQILSYQARKYAQDYESDLDWIEMGLQDDLDDE